jgi:phage gp29-like protein
LAWNPLSRLKSGNTPPRKKPDLNEIAVAQVTDKYSEYPSNGLTPVKLAAIFREADAGDVLRQMELFEEMEEKDPHLFSQLQTRKNAVTGLDYEINPFSDEPRDKEIAEFVREQIKALENFEEIQLDLLDSIGKGFAVSEIIWGYDEGHIVIEDVRSRHQKRFFWDGIDDSFKVRTLEHPEGILLPENKFILHRYKARSGHPSRAGVLRVVAWMYLFKNYDVKDWVSFAEVYGLPLRLGKYQQGASEDDKQALMQALIQIGADAAGIIPDGTTIEFITTEKTSSTDLYEKLARYCDEQISKAVLGQTLTSDSGGGSYAQSKTHNEVRHDLTVADCKALASTLRRYLIRPLVLYNFGEDKRIPSIKYDYEEAGDLEQDANIIGTLIEKTGLRVPTSFLYKKFSIPIPEKGEEIATPSYGGSITPLKHDPARQLALKSGGDPAHGSQERIDRMIDAATRKSAGTFKKAFSPVLKIIEKAESLEELRDMMEDDEAVAALFEEMDIASVEELLQKAMFYADLEGRIQR